jgi:hypothetical protein
MIRYSLRYLASVATMMLIASCGSPNRPVADATQPAQARHAAPAPATGPVGETAGRSARQSPATGPHVLGEHWVQDWRIRAVMQRIAVGANPNWPRDLRHDPEQSPTTAQVDRSLTDAAALADSLAAAAAQLPAVVANRPIRDGDRQDFIARAMTLRQQSLELKQQALAGRVEQAQRTLNAINTTCFDCHARHRDLSGVLEGGRAALDRGRGVWPYLLTADAGDRVPALEPG